MLDFGQKTCTIKGCVCNFHHFFFKNICIIDEKLVTLHPKTLR